MSFSFLALVWPFAIFLMGDGWKLNWTLITIYDLGVYLVLQDNWFAIGHSFFVGS